LRVIEQLQVRLEALRSERDEWRGRALAAEAFVAKAARGAGGAK
jgi:hypothetical protein